MSKLINIMLAIATLSLFIVTPVFSDVGCQNGKSVGSYVTALPNPDVWGDGTGVNHLYILQLNLRRHCI